MIWEPSKAHAQSEQSGLYRNADMVMRQIHPHYYVPRELPMFILSKAFLNKQEVRELVEWQQEQKPERVSVSGIGQLSNANLFPEDFPDLYDKLGQAMYEVNEQNWGFAVSGWVEPMSCIRYKRGDFNGWHADYTDTDRTKVGFSTLLTEDFTGGELEMLNAGTAPLVKPGDTVFFPGYQVHRVLRVKTGVRMSLAGWLGGPEFR